MFDNCKNFRNFVVSKKAGKTSECLRLTSDLPPTYLRLTANL